MINCIMSVTTPDWLMSIPEEILREIYIKVFNSCLDEMVTLHELREQENIYEKSQSYDDCICNTGRWCNECYGEYDLFD